MDFFNTDLHIHSPHSIAVSKNLNLDTMVETCKKKGTQYPWNWRCVAT